MTEKTKKILAREFLLSILLIFIVLLSFIGISCYNWFLSNKYNKIPGEIIQKTHLSDSLAFAYDIRTFHGKDYITRVYSALIDNHDNSVKSLNEETFRKTILSDTNLQFKVYRTLCENIDGFSKSFPEFVKALNFYLTDTDIMNKNKSVEIKQEIIQLENKRNEIIKSSFSPRQKRIFILNSLFLSFIIIFPIRYLILATIWSIKTLKR